MVTPIPERLTWVGAMSLLVLQQPQPLDAAFVRAPHMLLKPEAYRERFVEGWPGPYSNVRWDS